MSMMDSWDIPNYGAPNLNFTNEAASPLNYRPTNSLILGGTGSYNPAGNGMAGGIGSFSDTLGANIPTFQLGLSGINTLGNLYGAFQANNLAKSQFNYAKKITNTNLTNSIKSYNTTLSDRANARASVEGWSDQQTQDYVNKNKL